MDKSNVRLVSNIMVKSKYKNDNVGSVYLPYEILPKHLKDSRNIYRLTSEQEIQMNKYLFRAKRVIDVDEE